jgi:hypothetical protein
MSGTAYHVLNSKKDLISDTTIATFKSKLINEINKGGKIISEYVEQLTPNFGGYIQSYFYSFKRIMKCIL